tara:strand:- start:4241 stop:4960 length:720 start_codon:yes stop_codon:yes gene_type:complete
MYLSRIRYRDLHAASQAIHSALQDEKKGVRTHDYRSHQLLWQLFSEQELRSFLFVEQPSKGLQSIKGMPEYLVLSQHKPQQIDWCHVQTKPFNPKLFEGQRLAFQLRANPTITTTVKDDQKGIWIKKRHDVIMHAKKQYQENVEVTQQEYVEQAACSWLKQEQRMASGGYKIDSLHVIATQQHKLLQYRSKNSIYFSSVDYEGTLQVTNPDLFLKQINQGIGKSRSMGCGLWLIRPCPM